MAFATPPVVEESAPVVNALIVPAGVPPEVAPVVVVPLVPAGVPALTALVVALDPVNVSAGTVPAFPVKVCAAAVNVATVGVIVSFPPVVPTSPFAATVPTRVLPLNVEFSVHPVPHVPVVIIFMLPAGGTVPPFTLSNA
jgi:hypothetical protein